MKRPNVLLIVTDQQRADHVGFGGNPVVRTPNLDALAARATVFDRAYVANPICMPNRCSMLTGRVPSAHGVVFNDRSLAWTASTFPRQLRGAGYRTALIGKSHIQHGLSRNSLTRQPKPPAVIDPYPTGWDSLEDIERYVEGPVEMPADFYGFDHVEFALGHGDMVGGDHYRWAIENGAKPEDLLTRWPDGTNPARERYDGWWQVYQPDLPVEFYSTTFVADRTVDFIERVSRDGSPWFVECSFPDPHHPFTPPGDWWKAYAAEAMADPATFDDPLDDAPAHLRAIRALDPGPNIVQFFGPTLDQVRHARAAEYGMISMIDEGVGRVLAALERTGTAEDTVVIFTSDHGDMFGDHGLMLKCQMHYQGCLRVPFVIAAPGRAAARTRSLASTLDLAQTILELCDVEGFADMQGTSLVSVLDDAKLSVRDHVYIEEDFPMAAFVKFMPARVRTLITDAGRISRYSTGEVEVRDLEHDPDERINLAERPEGAALRAHLVERLSDALIQYSNAAKSAAA